MNLPLRSSTAVLNEAAALARLEGHSELLAEMAQLFLEDLPRLLLATQDALARTEAKALERAAHTLKGSLGNFVAIPAVAAAASLEKLAREGDFAGAASAYQVLEEELERLKPAMAALCREVTP